MHKETLDVVFSCHEKFFAKSNLNHSKDLKKPQKSYQGVNKTDTTAQSRRKINL